MPGIALEKNGCPSSWYLLLLCLVLSWGRLCWLRGLNLVGGRGASLAPLAEVRDDGDAHGGQGEGCGEQEGQQQLLSPPFDAGRLDELGELVPHNVLAEGNGWNEAGCDVV